MRVITMVLIGIACAACAATPSKEAASLHEADAAGVTGCQFVGTVTGRSLYGPVLDVSEKNAKTDAFEHATKLHATHVVFEPPISPPSGATTISGKAYKCS